jgi:hypothetical protein
MSRRHFARSVWFGLELIEPSFCFIQIGGAVPCLQLLLQRPRRADRLRANSGIQSIRRAGIDLPTRSNYSQLRKARGDSLPEPAGREYLFDMITSVRAYRNVPRVRPG